jgi:hypothetical protein
MAACSPQAALAALPQRLGGSSGAEPLHQLLGDWRFGAARFRFERRAGAVYGRSLASVRIGGCRIAAGTEVFRRYRFVGSRRGKDLWRGRLALVRGGGCAKTLAPSRISVASDLRFTESSRLPEADRPLASVFRRIRPKPSRGDLVIATWVRNGAGVVVSYTPRLYVGRARESFAIGNGCTVPAGTVVWRLRPLAPERYSGTIQTFLPPPDCRLGGLDPSHWALAGGGTQLVRRSTDARTFAYARG